MTTIQQLSPHARWLQAGTRVFLLYGMWHLANARTCHA